MDILILPDAHAHPGFDNRRFDWFGQLILDTRPDVVVDIGDLFDLPSLSSYEGGAKKAVQHLTYAEDIAVGLEAQDRIKQPLRVAKRKLPRFVRCLGNHENRITRALDIDPTLRGTLSLDDLESSHFGWEQHDFLERVEIGGITFSHYFPSGVMGRPVGGENIGKSLIRKNMVSCIQGHSHLFDYAVRTCSDGHNIIGMSVGCYIERAPEWANAMSYLWNSGVVVLTNVENGDCDVSRISIKSLRKVYDV